MKSPNRAVMPGAVAGPAISDDAVLASRIRLAVWCLLPLAALIETIVGRHAMNPDGISYLDMGDAIVRGDWGMAINAHWSPLYPLLQGIALRLFKPSAYSEFSVVHFVNFLIFLFTFACFDFMLRAAVAGRSEVGDIPGEGIPVPGWTVLALGYSVFLWSSLSLITMERVSPDLLMAGFLYLAMGLLLQIWARPQNISRFVLLGAVLGVGYLAKAPVFPLAFVFFAISWMLAGNWRSAAPRVLAAALVFLAVAGPWVVTLSKSKGRFTFGDSARFDYVHLVDGASPSYYLQNLGIAKGRFIHPVRTILETPAIYEFATPVRGTLPVWYDPSYWSEGAVPRVALGRQLSEVQRWVAYYFELLFTSQSALLVGFAILFFMAGRSLYLEQLMARWPVWLIALAGLGMYSLVLVELRYVAPFFTLFWVGLFSGLKVAPHRESQRLAPVVTLAVVIAIAGPAAVSVAGHLTLALKKRPHPQWQVADDLRKMGVMPGDRVARIGGRFGNVGWARLRRVTVAAELPSPGPRDFWCGSPEVQAQVIETFRRLGVTAIIADMIPPDEVYVPGPEWGKVGDGTYYALKIAPDGEK